MNKNNSNIHATYSPAISSAGNRSASRAFYDYFSIFGGRIGGTFMSAIIAAMVARILAPDDYGRFSIFLMAANFITVVFLNWPNSAVVRFGREEFIKKGRISGVLGSALGILAATLSVSILLVVIFRGRISGYLGSMRGLTALLVCFVLSGALYDLSFYALQAADKMKLYGIMPVLEKSWALAALAFIFFRGAADIRWVISIYIVGQLMVAAITACSLKKGVFLPLEFDFEYVLKILRYAWSIALGSISAFLMNWFDVIVIKKHFPINEVGFYSVSYRGMSVFFMLIMATISVTVPLMVTFRAGGRTDLIEKYVDDLVPQGVLLWSVFIAAAIIASPSAVPLLLGRAYEPCVPLFSALLTGMAFVSMGCFYTGFTASHDIVAPVVGITVFMSAVKVAGNAILVPRYGSIAAAYVTSAAFLAGNLVYIPVMNRSGRIVPSLRRYTVVLWTLPAVAAYMSVRAGLSASWRLLLFAFVLIMSAAAARAAGVFKADTLAVIDRMSMPPALKKIFMTLYGRLSV